MSDAFSIIMSNYTKAKQEITSVNCAKHIIIILRKGPLLTNLCSGNPEMTNLRTDEIVFFRNLTKIGSDENKAIYSISVTVLKILNSGDILLKEMKFM